VPAASIFRVQEIKILKMVAESVEHIVHNMSWEWFQLNSKDLEVHVCCPGHKEKKVQKIGIHNINPSSTACTQ
jgi:hypothetical protein